MKKNGLPNTKLTHALVLYWKINLKNINHKKAFL